MRKMTIAICLRCGEKYPQNISFQEVCSKCSNEICSLRVYGLKGKWTKIKELKIIKNKQKEQSKWKKLN